MVIGRVISKVTLVISPIWGLIALLMTTHEPPSGVSWNPWKATIPSKFVSVVNQSYEGLGFRVIYG